MKKEETHHLVQRWQERGDESARTELVVAWTPLVHKIARRYPACHRAMDDAMQEGRLGLARAIDDFDPERGASFMTFATMWIRNHISKFVESSGLVRLPTSKPVRKLWNTLPKVVREIESTGVEATPDAIAEHTGIALDIVHGVIASRQATAGAVSLNITANNSRESWLDNLRSPNDGSEEMLGAAQSRRRAALLVRSAVARLPAREAEVVRRHLLADEPETLEEIGVSLGVCREQARKIESEAIAKITRFVRFNSRSAA